jgi:hypothetical protein
MEVKDREHIRAVLNEYPLTQAELSALELVMPHRSGSIVDPGRIAQFETALAELRVILDAQA